MIEVYSPKIKPEHLARKAIVYLRQSSDKQVRQNKESQLLQYAVAERVRALGWAPGNLLTITAAPGVVMMRRDPRGAAPRVSKLAIKTSYRFLFLRRNSFTCR